MERWNKGIEALSQNTGGQLPFGQCITFHSHKVVVALWRADFADVIYIPPIPFIARTIRAVEDPSRSLQKLFKKNVVIDSTFHAVHL